MPWHTALLHEMLGWAVWASEGTSSIGESIAVKSGLHFSPDLCQARSYSYGLLLQAHVFSVNNRRNGDVSASFYMFLQSSVVSILNSCRKGVTGKAKNPLFNVQHQRWWQESPRVVNSTAETHEIPPYIPCWQFCFAQNAPVAVTSAATVCWGKAHFSLSISAPMLFYGDHGNILLFSLKTLKMDKGISPEFNQIFLSSFMSWKPELCEVTFVEYLISVGKELL